MMKFENIFNISLLIKKRISGELLQEEERELNEWLNEHPESEKYFAPSFMSSIDKRKDIEETIEVYERFIYKDRRNRLKRRVLGYVSSAAVLIGLFFGFIYFNSDTELHVAETIVKEVKKSFTEREERVAILELEDGSVMKVKDNREVIVVDSSKIRIDGKDVEVANKMVNNRLVIPRGTEHSIVLDDGTKVWLNADSELIFPSQFGRSERRVKGRGELYFEVAKDSSRPFIFESGDLSITVLGTEFNVRCYNDGKPNETTLVSGSVRLTANNREVILRPGHKCSVSEGDMTVTAVNVDEYISWTKGVFLYKNKPLRSIMDDFEKVYDVTVEFADKDLEGVTFSGSFKRYGDLNKILDMLKTSGNIKFKYLNDKIIILK